MDDRLKTNPFFVLGLDVGATSVEVERRGQKLLAMLELGHKGARTFLTPLGPVARTPELIRRSMQRLLDPECRFIDEVWARAPVTGDDSPTDASTDEEISPKSDSPWTRKTLTWWGGRS